MMADIILSIYYTKHADPQRNLHQKNDNFAYIKKFYESIIRHNMKAIIFHDGLSVDFIEKYQNDHIQFRLIPEKNYGLTSMNDIRFMIYLDFLLEHNSVEKVIISDAADVEFMTNVFDRITEDKLYVCYDRDRNYRHYYINNRIKLTYLCTENPFEGILDHKILQAGLFGGSYRMIVKCLSHMKDEFDHLVNKTYNTNYIVFNHVAYTNMNNHLGFSQNSSDSGLIKTRSGKTILYISW